MTIGATIETADDTLYARHIQSEISEINNRTRGARATYNLYIDDSELVVPSGTTFTVASGDTQVYNGADIDGTLDLNGTLIIYGSVDNDGTIDNDGTLTIKSGSKDFIQELLAYDRHAGSYGISTTLNNNQRYTERLPSNPNKSSLVVGITPDKDITDNNVAGKWGLIRNVTDQRTQPFTNSVLQLEIDILADYSEYADVTAVQNDLEI